MEERLTFSTEFFWEEVRKRGRAARQFNRSLVLPVVLFQFITIVVIITSWIVTDLDDTEVVEILSWQFFHAFTLIALIALLVLYVMVNRSMHVIETNHRGTRVEREPPSNFLWGVFVLQLLAFVVAVLLFLGGLFVFNPTNDGESSINSRIHVFYLIINVIATLTAVFASIVLLLLRSRMSKFVVHSKLIAASPEAAFVPLSPLDPVAQPVNYGPVSTMFPSDPMDPSAPPYNSSPSSSWNNLTVPGQRTGFPSYY